MIIFAYSKICNLKKIAKKEKLNQQQNIGYTVFLYFQKDDSYECCQLPYNCLQTKNISFLFFYKDKSSILLVSNIAFSVPTFQFHQTIFNKNFNMQLMTIIPQQLFVSNGQSLLIIHLNGNVLFNCLLG